MIKKSMNNLVTLRNKITLWSYKSSLLFFSSWRVSHTNKILRPTVVFFLSQEIYSSQLLHRWVIRYSERLNDLHNIMQVSRQTQMMINTKIINTISFCGVWVISKLQIQIYWQASTFFPSLLVFTLSCLWSFLYTWIHSSNSLRFLLIPYSFSIFLTHAFIVAPASFPI